MKEERILIFKVENPCSDNCEIKDITSCKTCNVKKRYYEAKTYDTAIEKMAKAMCKQGGICEATSCGDCTDWMGEISELAEAALKALLEE